ncbi:MAG: CopG family antitoxin [Candidatus Nitrotoga sp.]
MIYKHSQQLKSIPKFANEAEEQAFLGSARLYGLCGSEKAQRAVLPNSKSTTFKTISLSLPQHLLDSAKAVANISY